MKLNELILDFTIALTNEENEILERMDQVSPLSSFTEREQFIIDNLVRKSMVSKISTKNNSIMVVRNDQPTGS